MTKNSFYKIAILLVTNFWLLANLSGCGYTTKSLISNKFSTIYIEPFVNKIDITRENDAANKYKIYRPMLETDITKTVIDRFLFDGNLRPVKEGLSDLVLRGALTGFRRDPVRYTNNDEVEEYRLNLIVDISLWKRQENELLWEENGFVGDTTYFTSYTTAGTPKTEDVAISDAITDLARRIVERTVEQW